MVFLNTNFTFSFMSVLLQVLHNFKTVYAKTLYGQLDYNLESKPLTPGGHEITIWDVFV